MSDPNCQPPTEPPQPAPCPPPPAPCPPPPPRHATLRLRSKGFLKDCSGDNITGDEKLKNYLINWRANVPPTWATLCGFEQIEGCEYEYTFMLDWCRIPECMRTDSAGNPRYEFDNCDVGDPWLVCPQPIGQGPSCPPSVPPPPPPPCPGGEPEDPDEEPEGCCPQLYEGTDPNAEIDPTNPDAEVPEGAMFLEDANGCFWFRVALDAPWRGPLCPAGGGDGQTDAFDPPTAILSVASAQPCNAVTVDMRQSHSAPESPDPGIDWYSVVVLDAAGQQVDSKTNNVGTFVFDLCGETGPFTFNGTVQDPHGTGNDTVGTIDTVPAVTTVSVPAQLSEDLSDIPCPVDDWSIYSLNGRNFTSEQDFLGALNADAALTAGGKVYTGTECVDGVLHVLVVCGEDGVPPDEVLVDPAVGCEEIVDCVVEDIQRGAGEPTVWCLPLPDGCFKIDSIAYTPLDSEIAMAADFSGCPGTDLPSLITALNSCPGKPNDWEFGDFDEDGILCVKVPFGTTINYYHACTEILEPVLKDPGVPNSRVCQALIEGCMSCEALRERCDLGLTEDHQVLTTLPATRNDGRPLESGDWAVLNKGSHCEQHWKYSGSEWDGPFIEGALKYVYLGYIVMLSQRFGFGVYDFNIGVNGFYPLPSCVKFVEITLRCSSSGGEDTGGDGSLDAISISSGPLIASVDSHIHDHDANSATGMVPVGANGLLPIHIQSSHATGAIELAVVTLHGFYT